MKRFAQLMDALDWSKSNSTKISVLDQYFREAPSEDAIWLVALFTGRRPKRCVSNTQLQAWAAAESGLSSWMLAECTRQVGDLAESLSLILPSSPTQHPTPALHQMLQDMEQIASAPSAIQKDFVLEHWRLLPSTERFLFNKLLTGAFRAGVSEKLLATALARVYGKEETAVMYALLGNWQASDCTVETLLASNLDSEAAKPYPFCLAQPLTMAPANLGAAHEWQAEWHWEGIRLQAIKRQGQVNLWARGEALLNAQFPDLCAQLAHLPNGTVLDGQLLCVDNGQIMPFSSLQQRLGRKQPSVKMQTALPVALLCYDLLESDGRDLRPMPLQERRTALEQLLAAVPTTALLLSEKLPFSQWDALEQLRGRSRAQLAQGLFLKRLNAPYEAGRKTGNWWKWKSDPLRIDAVLLYAQKGQGQQANLFTEYTFALWEGDQLVPFAKTSSGLSEAEIKAVDAFIKANVLEKFGPVRTVKPELVFEIAFEGLQASKRHKAGVAVRLPSILRWRHDKLPEEANHLHELKVLLPLGD